MAGLVSHPFFNAFTIVLVSIAETVLNETTLNEGKA